MLGIVVFVRDQSLALLILEDLDLYTHPFRLSIRPHRICEGSYCERG